MTWLFPKTIDAILSSDRYPKSNYARFLNMPRAPFQVLVYPYRRVSGMNSSMYCSNALIPATGRPLPVAARMQKRPWMPPAAKLPKKPAFP